MLAEVNRSVFVKWYTRKDLIETICASSELQVKSKIGSN